MFKWLKNWASKFLHDNTVPIENNCVYPSTEESIRVKYDEKYKGAHEYIVKPCMGFNNGKTDYIPFMSIVSFVQKHDDGTVTNGFQSEQLALILLDRVKKLNAVYPHPSNKKQIKGLQMYLDACKERVDDRLERGVMGELEV